MGKSRIERKRAKAYILILNELEEAKLIAIEHYKLVIMFKGIDSPECKEAKEQIERIIMVQDNLENVATDIFNLAICFVIEVFEEKVNELEKNDGK